MLLSGVAAALRSRLPELGERMALRIRSDVASYNDDSLITRQSLSRSCAANADLVLNHLWQGGTLDVSSARQTGRARAEQGVPLADTLHAYRIGTELLWTELLAEARSHPEVTDDHLVSESARFWSLFGLLAEAVASAYREASTELTSRMQARRSAVVTSLFAGVTTDRTLWEAARELGLPEHGPYAVVVAEAVTSTGEGLADTEAALFRAKLPSVWESLPDQYLGLIALPAASSEKTCLRVLRRSGARVGFSPLFASLAEVPQALRFARLALSAQGASAGVVRYDDDPLAMVVAAAPTEATHLMRAVLGPVLGLPAAESSRLLRTLEHWFAAGGSAGDAAQSLFVHPNTVRYRLRRIEELTGRSLSAPRTAADVSVALLAVRSSAAKAERRSPAQADAG
ncbi:PucR family transcriptional regulator [Streptomyces sp. NPDC059524]|uniref:PucR family transcriptional regulator n=1 Tax=Streptomyces sp. NPDC059524 TaxID=3346856 RepID=UPI00367924C7